MQFQVDRLPLEAVIGWDVTQNGNLAELLQEPSLMGALEGAAITVLARGVKYPPGTDPFGVGPTAAGTFPAGTTLLTAANCTTSSTNTTNPFRSNFWCNPSAIDGLGITNSSQGGGGIFVHGWGHNIQIANNRIANNSGTLSGGINIGQGEFPPGYTVGSTTNADPRPCQSQTGLPAGTQLQYCLDLNVNVHHNAVTANMSVGDELFSATPAGAGGGAVCRRLRSCIMRHKSARGGPSDPLQLVLGEDHQQHHRRQRCRLGWRWNFAAGCVGGEHHQQHHHLQRHHRFSGSAVQYARGSAGQLVGADVHLELRHDIGAATGWTRGHSEQLEPDREYSRNDHLPRGSLRRHHGQQRNLPDRLVPGAV